MNTLQRKILIAVACIVGAMLLFPPFLCQSSAIGYAFIFSTSGKCAGNAGTINSSQLLIQWIGTLIIGAIAFILAKDYQPNPRLDHKEIYPPRKAYVRAIPWAYLGFISGFVSDGQPFLARIGLHLANGVSGAIFVYLIAMAIYAIFKPTDHGNGGWIGLTKRIAIFLGIGALIGGIAAMTLPNLFGDNGNSKRTEKFIFDDQDAKP